MYVKNPYARTLTREERIVLCNTKTGAFIRTPVSYYEELEKCLEAEEQKIYAAEKKMEEVLKYLFKELCKIEYYIPLEKMKQTYQMPMQIVYLSVTNRCNLQCKHCASSAYGASGEDPVSTEEWKHIIDQLAAINPEQITFTGGEPLLRTDFVELLNYTRDKCCNSKLVLSTNGLLINDSNTADIVKNVSTVAISLDGYDDKSCSMVRGKGVYQRVLEAIKRLQANGYSKISLSMLESAYTQGHDSEFYALCQRLQVKPLLRRFTPTGRGEENRRELMPWSEPECEKLVSQENVRCMLCRPGRKELDISADGNVYPCAPLAEVKELCMGNLKEKSLKEILDPQKAECMVEHLRPWKMEVCRDCDVNLFCHSCINYIRGIKQDPEQFQKICRETKVELEKFVWR